MKLTILLFLAIVPLLLCSTSYTVLGVLSPLTTAEFNPAQTGIYSAFYLDVSNFQIGTGFYLKMSIIDGNFEHTTMYVGGSNTIVSSVSLPTPILSYFADGSKKELQFYVYKDNYYNYLYFAPPPPTSSYTAKTLIKITNTIGPVYYLLGDIYRYGSKTYTPTEKGLFGIFCLDTINFKNRENGYFFKMYMSASGEFSSNQLFYGTSDTKFSTGQQITLETYVTSTSPYYNLLTFTIPRFAHRYLYIAPPPPAYNYYKKEFQVTLYNTPQQYGQQYKVMGELDRNSNDTITPYTDGPFCAYYVKVDSKETKLYFDAKISNGEFEHEYMYYTGSNIKYNKGQYIPLYDYVGRDAAGTTFTINKPSTEYLYIAPPTPYSYNSQSVITVSNPSSSNTNKVALGVGIGVGAAVLIAIIIIIVYCKNKSGSVESTTIDTSKTDPVHLGAAHY